MKKTISAQDHTPSWTSLHLMIGDIKVQLPLPELETILRTIPASEVPLGGVQTESNYSHGSWTSGHCMGLVPKGLPSKFVAL